MIHVVHGVGWYHSFIFGRWHDGIWLPFAGNRLKGAQVWHLDRVKILCLFLYRTKPEREKMLRSFGGEGKHDKDRKKWDLAVGGLARTSSAIYQRGNGNIHPIRVWYTSRLQSKSIFWVPKAGGRGAGTRNSGLLLYYCIIYMATVARREIEKVGRPHMISR